MSWHTLGILISVLIITSVISSRYEQSCSTPQVITEKLSEIIKKDHFTIIYAHDFLKLMLINSERHQELYKLLLEGRVMSGNFRIKGAMIGTAKIYENGFSFKINCYQNLSSEPDHYIVIYADGEMHGGSTISIPKEKLLPFIQLYKK
jgi:hypothetical protein